MGRDGRCLLDKSRAEVDATLFGLIKEISPRGTTKERARAEPSVRDKEPQASVAACVAAATSTLNTGSILICFRVVLRVDKRDLFSGLGVRESPGEIVYAGVRVGWKPFAVDCGIVLKEELLELDGLSGSEDGIRGTARGTGLVGDVLGPAVVRPLPTFLHSCPFFSASILLISNACKSSTLS